MTRPGSGCARLALVAIAGMLVLGGCSGASDDAGPQSSPTSPPASAPAPTTPEAAAASTEVTATDRSSTDGNVAVPADLEDAESTPVEDPYFPDTSNPETDVLHYQLDLTYTHPPILSGTTTVTYRVARATGRVRLDLADPLQVSSVRLDGARTAYTQRDNGLVMRTPGAQADSVHELVIAYAGTPPPATADIERFGPTGLGWHTDHEGNVYTFQEPFGAYTWYPSNDHPSDEAYVDASITTKVGDVGVFNGTLRSSKTSRGQTTSVWHLGVPVATYLTTIAIGDYTEYTARTASGTTLSFWLLPQDKQRLPVLRREAVRSFDWLVDHAGPYPFSSLGMVVVDGGDAMETQTMMTLGRSVFTRPDSVVEHEMAHQWFGDSVSPIDWQGMWLNEGWAMYMQQWYESDRGLYEYAGGIDEWRQYDNDSRKTSGPPGDYDPRYYGDLNVYLGPAMMLDKIRQQIGDAEFGAFVQAWAADHAGQNVDRADFIRWVNQQTGRNFTPLINRWLDSPTTPPF